MAGSFGRCCLISGSFDKKKRNPEKGRKHEGKRKAQLAAQPAQRQSHFVSPQSQHSPAKVAVVNAGSVDFIVVSSSMSLSCVLLPSLRWRASTLRRTALPIKISKHNEHM